MRSELAAANGEIENLENQLAEIFEPTRQDAEIQNLKPEVEWLESELSDRSQTPAENSDPASKDLPDAAEVYNRYKTENSKGKATYKDAAALMEIAKTMMKKSGDDSAQGN